MGFDFMRVQLKQFFNEDRNDTERKYATFRHLAYQHVTSRICFAGLTYQMDGIGHSALKTFEQTWQREKRLVNWNWVEQVGFWQRKQHSRLELAIWSGQVLCGMMLGSTSRRKKILYIEGIEGAPSGHPMKGKIIPLCIEVAEAYAALLNSSEIRLVSPAEGLIPLYQQLGYNLRQNWLRSYAVKHTRR